MGSTKTKKEQTVNLSPSVMAMLVTRKEAQQPQPADLVFTTPTGLSINDRNFKKRAWTQVLKTVGVTHRKPYSTSRTAISHALENFANPLDVAAQCGHNPQTLFKHYTHVI